MSPLHAMTATVILAVCATLSCVSLPRPKHEGVSVDYDEFTKSTVVTLETIVNSREDLAFTCLAVKGSHRVLASLRSSSNDWRYLRCHNVHWLLDGEPIERIETKHDGRVGSGYVLEFVEMEFPSEIFQRFARANSIRGRLCNTEFTLSPAQIALLAEFVSAAELSSTDAINGGTH